METRLPQTNNRVILATFAAWGLITIAFCTSCARPTAVDQTSADTTRNDLFMDSRGRQYDSVSESELTQLVSTTDEPVLVEVGVDFNCVRCDQMTTIVNNLEKQFADQTRIVRVGFNPSSAFQARLGLRICPSYLFYQSGQLVDRHDGPALLPTLHSKLSRLIANDAGFKAVGNSPISQHVEMFE